MKRMRKESLIVSKNGVESRWNYHTAPAKAMDHTKVTYAKGAQMGIVMSRPGCKDQVLEALHLNRKLGKTASELLHQT